MKTIARFAAAAALAAATVATPASTQESGGMAPAKPSEESRALAPFFGRTVAWTGTVPEGALGRDAPATTSQGRADCRELFGGLWYLCEVENTMGAGDEAIVWKGHLLVGYDLGAESYRGVVVDNMGQMAEYDGELEGDTFVLETTEQVPFMDLMATNRLTWTRTGRGTLRFTNEHQFEDGDWTLFESAEMKPLGGKPAGSGGKK